jgi:hypothetical protein
MMGVPQLDFMNRALIKLAKVVEHRDLSETQFMQLLDPRHEAKMTEQQFKQSMASCRAPDF